MVGLQHNSLSHTHTHWGTRTLFSSQVHVSVRTPNITRCIFCTGLKHISILICETHLKVFLGRVGQKFFWRNLLLKKTCKVLSKCLMMLPSPALWCLTSLVRSISLSPRPAPRPAVQSRPRRTAGSHTLHYQTHTTLLKLILSQCEPVPGQHWPTQEAAVQEGLALCTS